MTSYLFKVLHRWCDSDLSSLMQMGEWVNSNRYRVVVHDCKIDTWYDILSTGSTNRVVRWIFQV